jgi:hypothetical protein
LSSIHLRPDIPAATGGIEKADRILERTEFTPLTKQELRKLKAVECVRLKRDSAIQSLGFASRPFVLCGLSSSASGARNFMKMPF